MNFKKKRGIIIIKKRSQRASPSPVWEKQFFIKDTWDNELWHPGIRGEYLPHAFIELLLSLSACHLCNTTGPENLDKGVNRLGPTLCCCYRAQCIRASHSLSLSPQMKATHHIHACKRGSGVGLSPVPCFLVLEAAYLWSFPLKSTAVEVAGKCAEFLVFLLRPPFYVRFSSWNSRFPWACLASRVILVTHKKTQLAGFDSWYFRGHHFPKMAASLCVGRRQFEEWIGRNDLHHSSFIWNTQECGLCAG